MSHLELLLLLLHTQNSNLKLYKFNMFVYSNLVSNISVQMYEIGEEILHIHLLCPTLTDDLLLIALYIYAMAYMHIIAMYLNRVDV